MSRSKGRELQLNILMACSSVVVFVLVAEVILTILMPVVFRPRFTKLDRHVGWYHSPGVSGIDEKEGHRYLISYNSHGYRAPERAHERQDGRRRVVVLGDSFTDGTEVGDEELFTWKIEKALADVEVINLGVYGYQTAQELVTLERVGLRFSPDAVVLVTVPNDFPGNVVGLESFGPAPRFVLDGESISFEDLDHPNAREAFRAANLPVPHWVHRSSTLYYLLNTHIYQRLAAERIKRFRDNRLASASPEQMRELYRRIVLRIRDICDDHRIPLLVVFAHQRVDVTRNESSPLADLATSLRESKIATVDLFERLQEQERIGPTPFYLNDPHWNTLGHEKVAQWLTQPLQSLLAGEPGAVRE
jgi:hypothetical protein